MLDKEFEYVSSKELDEAISVAEITKRPLLVKGEPGTGKTLLAEYIAKQKNIPIFRWHIKSTTLARDGLYFYDAVTRLNDSRFGSKERDVNNINDYIRMEPMGEAFSLGSPCVLLIDEIDKADIEFPNDLLLELDRMEFSILETGETVKAIERPLVVITSNSEKELPDAFLRRCIFHYIDFPDSDMMSSIVNAHFPEVDKKLMTRALEAFYALREKQGLFKKPSTSELVDWIKVLLHQGSTLERQNTLPYIGSLLKNEKDLEKNK